MRDRPSSVSGQMRGGWSLGQLAAVGSLAIVAWLPIALLAYWLL